MPFENKTNHGRVKKAVEFIQLVADSAETNGSSEDEVWTMLEPVMESIQNIFDTQVEKPSDSYEKHYHAVRGDLQTAYNGINAAMEKLGEDDIRGAMAVLKDVMAS